MENLTASSQRREIITIQKSGKAHGKIVIEEDGTLSFYRKGTEVHHRDGNGEIYEGDVNINWTDLFDIVMDIKPQTKNEKFKLD